MDRARPEDLHRSPRAYGFLRSHQGAGHLAGKRAEEFSIDETYDDTVDTATGVESVFKAIQENAAQEVKDDPLFQYNMGLAYRETAFDEAIDAFRKVVGTGRKALYDAFVMLGITYRERGPLP